MFSFRINCISRPVLEIWKREVAMNEQMSINNLVGKTIGVYQIEQLVEQNVLGAIYMAKSRTSELTYRFRVLRSSSTMSPESRIVFLGLFQQYARELAGFLSDDEGMQKHPHLLPLVDFGSVQGIPYLVSLYTPMKSLTELLTMHKSLDVVTIGQYLDQMAVVLEYAHYHAALHSDLSTDAVFIRDNDRLVIADLGVMRILELSLKTELQTLLYVHSPSSTPAPEQLLDQPENTYTDVYAMAALLYRLLTGHRVFSSHSPEQIAEQHLQAPVPSLMKWKSIIVGERDITSELDELLASAMTKDPQQRIQHPAELANSYHNIVAPNNTERQPIVSRLALAVASSTNPSMRAVRLAKNRPRSLSGGTRPVPAIAARPVPMHHNRRRTLAFIGGGVVVAIGAIAVIADQFLNKQGTVTTSNAPVNTSSAHSVTINNGSKQTTNTTAQPAQTAVSGNVIARTSVIPLNSAITFKNPDPNSSHPAVLVHLSNNQFVAFDSTCPHAGCAVSYNVQDKLLECPCHGAIFDPAKQAAVVQGPADRPLTPVQITVHSDGSITAA
jgi:eukaryotic-like serine/threonine-protein kinase